MATLLQNVATADAYTQALTLGPHPDAVSVLLRVGSQPVLVTFWTRSEGLRTPAEEGQERYYNANTIVSVRNVYGVKVRSAVAGSPSVISLELVEDEASDPAVEFQSTGTATPSAQPVITQQVFKGAQAGVYTLPTGCIAILVECIAGGGGGAGAPLTAAGQASAGGGGGGGGYARRLITAFPNGPQYNFSVGGGGAAGAAGGNGANGNITSFASIGMNESTRAFPGQGGQAGVAAAPPVVSAGQGGAGGSGPLAVGDIGVDGDPGGNGRCFGVGGSNQLGGRGGDASGPYGGGGGLEAGPNASQAVAGGQYGGGGSGAVNAQSAAAKVGAAGADGILVVTEFYR